MILFGCLLAIAAAFAPRVVLILMWIVGPRVNAAFQSWIWPLLGVIFAPYTTIMYVLVWNPVTGVTGWDWVWIALGVWLDVLKWRTVIENRSNVPGMGSTDPEPASADTLPAAAVEVSTSDELDNLADLREKGVITEEEYEEKKKQLSEQ